MEKFPIIDDSIVNRIVKITNIVNAHKQKADEYLKNKDYQNVQKEGLEIMKIHTIHTIEAFALREAIQGGNNVKIPIKELLATDEVDKLTIIDKISTYDISEKLWREGIEELGFIKLEDESDDDHIVVSWAHRID